MGGGFGLTRMGNLTLSALYLKVAYKVLLDAVVVGVAAAVVVVTGSSKSGIESSSSDALSSFGESLPDSMRTPRAEM